MEGRVEAARGTVVAAMVAACTVGVATVTVIVGEMLVGRAVVERQVMEKWAVAGTGRATSVGEARVMAVAATVAACTVVE